MRTNASWKAGVLMAGCALLGATAAMAAPVGELEVRGQARVGQSGVDGNVAVNNTRYSWFAGDRVETRRGAHAILNLEAGASFGIGENTSVSVDVENGIAVALERGVILYVVEERAGAMTLVSGEYTFTTESNEPRALLVSDEPMLSMGKIQVLEDGSLEVTVRAGVLEASSIAAGVQYQVAAGDSVRFSDGEVRAVQVQIEAVAEEEDDDGGIIWWARNNPGLAAISAVGVAAAGYGLYSWQFSSSSKDEEPVSP